MFEKHHQCLPNKFGCTALGDYSYLHLKTHVFLLTDMFACVLDVHVLIIVY